MTVTLPATPVLQHALEDIDTLRLEEAKHYARARLSSVAFRESSGGAAWRIFEGHATVFNQKTLLFEYSWAGAMTRVFEQIEPQAFDPVLASSPDVHFVDQHDMSKRLARTGVKGMGQLDLSTDGVGLRVYAQLNPNKALVKELEIDMNDGLVDQMSFAFTIARETRDSHTDDDGNEDVTYTIHEIGNLYDVSTVSQGAYPTTDAGLRYRSRILADLSRAGDTPAGKAAAQLRDGENPSGAKDDAAAATPGVASTQLLRAQALAQVRTGRSLHPTGVTE